jgi:hypothetical protein
VFALFLSFLSWTITASLVTRFTAAQEATWVASVSAVVTYGLTVVLWYRVLLSRRFSPYAWQKILNEKHQVMDEVHDRKLMETRLKRLKTSVLRGELAFQCGMLLAVLFLLSGHATRETSFPAGLILLCGAVLFSDKAYSVCVQAYRHALSRVSVVEHELDLAKFKEPLDSEDKWERMQLFLKNNFEFTITILSIVLGLASLFDPVMTYARYFMNMLIPGK